MIAVVNINMLIDADAHIATPDCFETLDNREFVDRYLTHYHKTGNLKTAEQQKKEAQEQGVTHQVLNFFGANTGLNYHHSLNDAVKIAKVYNTSMSAIVNNSDGFFSATGWIPMQNISASLTEIDRIKQLNLFAVFVDDTVAWGRANWSKPVFQRCAELNLPMYIHFTKVEHNIDNNLQDIDDEDIIKKLKFNTWDLQCNLDGSIDFLKMLYSMIESEWLDEFKTIKFVIAERGIDWIKPFVQFCDEHTGKDTLALLQKHFWFTTEPEHKNFVQDAEYIGWDKVLFASDHGHNADCGGANFGYDLDTIKKFNLQTDIVELITYKNFQQLIRS